MATNLNKAKKAKNDEFYTLYSDVEKELAHYQQHFKGKIVYCNCDNPERSAFWRYFHINFSALGLKKARLNCTFGGNNEQEANYEVFYDAVATNHPSCSKSKEFSMDDFNYGLSELIWEIKQPDGQIITRNFYLIKFNGELPDDKGNGYKLNGDLNDPATFRNKKISVLPPAKVEQDKSTSVAGKKPSPNSKTLKNGEE